MKKNKVLIVLVILMLVLITWASISLREMNYRVEEINSTLANIKKNDESLKNLVNELKNTYDNNEIVGLLEIPNTDYKALITQSTDNSKYLSHDAYGKKNKIGNPYLDYRVDINNDNKLLIYGHNSRYTEMPFKILENYYDEDYYKEHKYIKITTDEKVMTYEIFSAYVETSDWYYMNIEFKDKVEWLNHLEKLKSKSIYETNVDVSENDQILILQTCSTKKEYRNLKRKFLLVISRRVDL